MSIPKKDKELSLLQIPAKEDDVIYVGIDDGHYAIKLVTDTGMSFTIPSRAQAGKHLISIKENDGGMFYDTEEGHTFTVSEFLPQYEDTRFLDYQKSELIRVLVSHALRVAGLGGRFVRITVGLPVSYYYLPGGVQNQPLIDAKIKNLFKKATCGDTPLANIIGITVAIEAVSSFVDQLMNLDGTQSPEYDDLMRCNVGVIDVGGKTTDCALILPGMTVDPARSGSSDVGVLMLVESVASKLRSRFDLSTDLPAWIIERALTTGVVKISGKEQSVADIIDTEKQLLADRIMSAVRTKVGSGADLEFVLFVGGGAIVLRDQLLKHYPHARVPEKPEFANARGMLKFAKHVIGAR